MSCHASGLLATLVLVAPAAALAQSPVTGLVPPSTAVSCDVDSNGLTERCWIDATAGRSVLKVAACDEAGCRLRAEAVLALQKGVRSPAIACDEGSLILAIPQDASRPVEQRVALGLDGDVLRVRAAGSSVADADRGGSSFELDFRTGLALWDVAGKTSIRRRGPVAYVGRLPEGEVAPAAAADIWSNGWTGLPSGDQVRFLASGDRLFVGIKTAWRGKRPARVLRGSGGKPAVALGAKSGPVPLDCARAPSCVHLDVAAAGVAGQVQDLPDGEGVIVSLPLASFLPGGVKERPVLTAYEIVRVGTCLADEPAAPDPAVEDVLPSGPLSGKPAVDRSARYKSQVRASDPFAFVRARWIGVAVLLPESDRLPVFDGRLPWLPGGW